jgi:multiple sugar transport system substrate-binding protein
MARQRSMEHPSRRLRGWQLAALVGAVGALAVAGCSSSSSSSSSSSTGSGTATTPAGGTSSAAGTATSGSITWWASPITSNAKYGDTRTALINAFEKQYPNIHVSLTSAPTDTDTNRATLVTTISGGAATPDVFMGDVIWPAQFGAHQLAVPLSNYLPASYWSQFAPGLVQGASYKGQVYGSPLFEDQGFMYYRKDLLAKAGLQPPTTWQQLETEAKTLVSSHAVKYGFVWQGASYEGLTCNFMEYLASAGGTATNSSYTQATLDSPQASQALTFMRSLITSGASPAAVTTFQEAQAMNTFAAGDAAFLRNWDYAYTAATDPATSKLTAAQVGVEPMPAFAGQPTPGYSNIGGWNLYINPHSKNVAADLTFIKFMASPTAQTILATEFSEIPTTTVVRNSPQVIALNPVLAIVGKTKLVPRPAGTPNYPQLSTAIYTNVNAALAGSTSAASALAAAQSQANTALTSAAGGL